MALPVIVFSYLGSVIHDVPVPFTPLKQGHKHCTVEGPAPRRLRRHRGDDRVQCMRGGVRRTGGDAAEAGPPAWTARRGRGARATQEDLRQVRALEIPRDQ